MTTYVSHSNIATHYSRTGFTVRTGCGTLVPMVVATYKITQAREQLSAIFDRTIRDDALSVIQRGAEPPAALLSSDRLLEALAALAPMAAEVSVHPDSVSAWLSNVPVHAQGADIDEAARNLVAAVRDYSDLWQSSLHTASNHVRNWPVVYRAGLLDDDSLIKVMFNDEI